MRTLISRLDRALVGLLEQLCNVIMAALTLIVLYSIVMRYLFAMPPFWGDIAAVMCNVAVSLLGVALVVRRRELMAMQALYEKISPRLALFLEALWNILILLFGLVLVWYGWEAAMNVPGFYWELFGLPQKYPMLLMPLSGILLTLACIRVLVEDIAKFHALGGGAAGRR